MSVREASTHAVETHRTGRAVLSVAMIAFIGIGLLPFLAIGGALVGLGQLVYPVWVLVIGLFPFLGLRPANPLSGGGITAFPVTFTVLHWVILAIANVALVRGGISKRPFASALVLVGVSAVLALLIAIAFGLRFDEIHN